MPVSGSGSGDICTVCIDWYVPWLIPRQMYSNSQCSYSVQKNGLAEVEENDSNDTLDNDDDAHKVNLHTRSCFFCIR